MLRLVLAVFLLSLCTTQFVNAGDDPLSTWNDSASKREIISFVKDVTDPKSPNFVKPQERIATYDNDGTLWKEAPVYTQIIFALNQVKAMAPDHPEWKDNPALDAAIKGDHKALAATGMKGVVEVLMATHAGMTTQDFEKIAAEWLATAKDARFKRPYPSLTYAPMVELLGYLRANGFKNYIVSGGGVEFMRPWTEKAYGIPPEQVIGSSIKTKFEMRDGKPVLMRQPEVFFIDDKEGKPIGIQKFIGRRPIAAFGNSDADIQMLQWTLAGSGRRLAMLVHHTDAEREYAYDRDTHVGKLAKGIDDAKAEGWMLIDMKNDWKTVFSAN